MNSKLVNAESDLCADMIVNAVKNVKNADNKYPIKSIQILKAHGQSLRDSKLIPGYGLALGRAAQGLPIKVTNAKIACLDIDLRKYKCAYGVNVLVENPAELENIRQEEMNITRKRCQMLIDAGANVVLTTKGIDDLALKYF
jgi:T-complex protein 1 subunit alpha